MIKALKMYLKALEKDDSNIYAVLGLANIIGEHGMSFEASKLYKLIVEMKPDIPHAYVNLAHLSGGDGNNATSLAMYRKCLADFYTPQSNDQI